MKRNYFWVWKVSPGRSIWRLLSSKLTNSDYDVTRDKIESQTKLRYEGCLTGVGYWFVPFVCFCRDGGRLCLTRLLKLKPTSWEPTKMIMKESDELTDLPKICWKRGRGSESRVPRKSLRDKGEAKGGVSTKRLLWERVN